MMIPAVKRPGYTYLFAFILTLCLAGTAGAQNNTNSPYSRFGYGELPLEGSSMTRGMGGTAIALRNKLQVNYLNPASYTVMDSLSFVMEGGMSFQNTNFSQNGVKKNARNTSLDMAAFQLRFGKWAAMSIGLTPLSNMGFAVYKGREDELDDQNNVITTNSGEGGLHQAYGGLAFKVLKGLSVGVNMAYVWGDLKHEIIQSFVNSDDAMAFERVEDVSIKTYKADLGIQYTRRLSRYSDLTLGAVVTPGHRMSNKAYVDESLGNTVTGYTATYRDTLISTDMPTKIGVGLAYSYRGRLTLATDFFMEKWSTAFVMGQKGSMADRTRFSLGAEYRRNEYGSFLERTRYRVGAYVCSPYYMINGKRALREYGVTLGISLPMGNTNSMIHFTGQYAYSKALQEGLMSEKTVRLSVAVSFNERWFFKRLVN